jgi:hypothetical protein
MAKKANAPILKTIDHESLPFSVVVEDDGRVAYAYLMHGDAIIGDVWLRLSVGVGVARMRSWRRGDEFVD